jgi:hypothetical protein
MGIAKREKLHVYFLPLKKTAISFSPQHAMSWNCEERLNTKLLCPQETWFLLTDPPHAADARGKGVQLPPLARLPATNSRRCS